MKGSIGIWRVKCEVYALLSSVFQSRRYLDLVKLRDRYKQLNYPLRHNLKVSKDEFLHPLI